MKTINISEHAIGEWFEVFVILKGTKEKIEQMRSLREFIHGDDVPHLDGTKYVVMGISNCDGECAKRGELNVVRFDFNNPIDAVSDFEKGTSPAEVVEMVRQREQKAKEDAEKAKATTVSAATASGAASPEAKKQGFVNPFNLQ